MKNLRTLIAAGALASVCAGAPAFAQSTIDPTKPQNGLPYQASVIRNNFQAAANDINALYASLTSAETCSFGTAAPSSPTSGRCWIDSSTSTWRIKIYDGVTSQWVLANSIDSVNSLLMPQVGGGVVPTLASAATVDLGSVTPAAVIVSGSVGITSFGSAAATGSLKFVSFSGSPTLTNSSNLQLPGGANRTMAAGQSLIAVYLGSGQWLVEAPGSIAGPATSVVGNAATWADTIGSTLADSGVALRNNAVATDFSQAYQALFMDGTYTGSGTGPYAEISVADTAGDSTAGTALSALRIDHHIASGASAGNRNAFAPVLSYDATVPGTDGTLTFYAASFPQAYYRANGGGDAVTYRSDAYASNCLTQLENGATYWSHATCGEFDISVQTGASVKYKSILSLASVNSDAVKGVSQDAMLEFVTDATTTARFDTGIMFGRPDAVWPIDTTTGTLIGVSAGVSAGALWGIDFNNVAFDASGGAFRSPGFSIDKFGNGSSATFGMSSTFPSLLFVSSTASTKERIANDATGNLLFQINTAVSGDFSTNNLAIAIAPSGAVAIGTSTFTPNVNLDVAGTLRVTQASPAAADACAAGQIVGDANYLYTCSASGAWKRVAVTGGY